MQNQSTLMVALKGKKKIATINYMWLMNLGRAWKNSSWILSFDTKTKMFPKAKVRGDKDRKQPYIYNFRVRANNDYLNGWQRMNMNKLGW